MAYRNDIEEQLKLISEETGIHFSIDETELSEDELLASLQKVTEKLSSTVTRSDFLRSLLQGNLSSAALDDGLSRYHLFPASSISLYQIDCRQEFNDMATSILSNIFDPISSEIVPMNTSTIVVITSSDDEITSSAMRLTASEIVDAMMTEAYLSTTVSYDTAVADYHDLPGIYKNAYLASQIGQAFYSAESIYAYHELGLGKLVSTIPDEACQSFLEDNLPELDFRELDTETMNIIKSFFDHDLNIAETARHLYLHRNTLVYRLDKFQKDTGLDLRNFQDALRCQIGLLLSKKLYNS